MNQTQLSYFIYKDIPGAGKGWLLAVLATGRRDADRYVRAVHHGGHFQQAIEHGGTVNASCGAVTQAAHDVLAARQQTELEKELEREDEQLGL